MAPFILIERAYYIRIIRPTCNLKYHFLQESRTKFSIAQSGIAQSRDAKNARDAKG